MLFCSCISWASCNCICRSLLCKWVTLAIQQCIINLCPKVTVIPKSLFCSFSFHTPCVFCLEVFDATIDFIRRDAFEQATHAWERGTCIRFKEGGDKPRIRVVAPWPARVPYTNVILFGYLYVICPLDILYIIIFVYSQKGYICI